MKSSNIRRQGAHQHCRSRHRVTARSILSCLFLLPVTNALQINPFLPPAILPEPIQGQDQSQSHGQTFTLRHVFHRGTYQNPDLHRRLDIAPSDQNAFAFAEGESDLTPPATLKIRSEAYEIDRLRDRSWASIQSHLDYAGLTGEPAKLEATEWIREEIPGPDTTDKETVINLAYMAANAYVSDKSDPEWSNITTGYNHSTPFGWEGDGLRGHIFADEGNKTIIIGLKGTSPAVFDGDGTTTRDKLNDNLFFSCCCGQGGQYFWRQVCDCQTSVNTCNSTCVVKALKSKTRYYHASVDLYNNVTELYPDSNVWIVGHSLGGAVSSLLGLTFGLPVVTFEAPGDDLAARRLGLPVPPPSGAAHPPNRGKYTGARHFGHTADPIFTGTCNTATATCTLGGYAMESQCHTGLQCVYDTVADMGWRSGIGYHKIHNVIDTVIRKYKDLPKCQADTECYDCYKWKFFESNGSEPITTTTTKKIKPTYTRTTTCETPGWWGCLDPSSTSSIPIITTTYTTTTCLTPGWFGCKEEANTTITTTTLAPTTSTVSTTTTTCRHGWFGDDCGSTTSSTTQSTPTQTSTTEEVCETPGIFFGCWDDDDKKKKHQTTHHPTTITSPPGTVTRTVTKTSADTSTNPATSKKEPHKDKKCKHPVFFGLICLDSTAADAESWELPLAQTTQYGQGSGHSSEL